MRTALSIFSAWCLLSGVALGQYSIDWYTIDGGGGTSTGGVYTVSGTIGQPDAGTMSGGPYTLTGGFWSIIAAVQEPGSPLLTVQVTATNSVVITWPHPSTGFNLEENTVIEGGTWSAVSATPVKVENTWQVIVAPPTGNRFYRLKKQ